MALSKRGAVVAPLSNEGARELAERMIGSPELVAAGEVVVRGECVAWWRHAITPEPRGLGLTTRFELLGALCQAGYQQLAGLCGSPDERDEIARRADRIALLRAVATLEGSLLS